jgi:raffinose/stachyose/melibiose transport system substrate-binding protein
MKRRTIRLAGIISLAILLLPLLAACGTSAGASGPVTLRIWYSTDDPVERAWSQGLATAFERSHPDIRVDLVDYSFEDLNTKLQLALSAGDPPDLAYVTPRGPGIPAYIGAHKLRDLSAPARTMAWASKLRPGLLAAYNRPFAGYGAPAGHVMAVPTALAAVAVVYNKRLLARLHLQAPSSLPAFEAALARARSAGIVPIGMGNADGWLGDDWYLTLVNSLVPPSRLAPEQSLSRSFSFQRPPYLSAGQTLQRWAQRSYFTSDFGGLDAQEGVDQFFRGNTLFQLVSSSENAQILADQRKTGLPIGIFAFPAASGRPGTTVPQSGYLGWVVPAASRQPRQAVEFINSLLASGITRYLLQQGVVPAANPPPGKANAAGWQQQYLRAVDTAQPGIYLDAAPIANLNGTMEANVQLLLQGIEGPQFLVKALQSVYASRGHGGSTARIDGEF